MTDRAVNRHRYWCCPYFRYDGLRSINCEGGDLPALRVSFPSKEAAEAHMDACCADHPGWNDCLIARALNDYYDELEEEEEREKHRKNQLAGEPGAGPAGPAEGINAEDQEFGAGGRRGE